MSFYDALSWLVWRFSGFAGNKLAFQEYFIIPVFQMQAVRDWILWEENLREWKTY